MTLNTPYYKEGSVPVATLAPTTPSVPIQASVVDTVVTNSQNVYFRSLERTFYHKLSLFLNILAIGSSVNIAVGQIFGMAMKHCTMNEVFVRVYTISICVLIVLNELDWADICKRSPLVNQYFWRGLFYSFIGVLGAMLNDIGNDNKYQNRYNWNNYNRNNSNGYITFYIPTVEGALEWYLLVMSRILLLSGIMYVIMGLLFLQSRIERDILTYRQTLEEAEQAMATASNRLNTQSRLGGRLGDEFGIV